MCGSVENVRQCSGCNYTKYCSRKCQKSHHKHHTAYCGAINQLEELEKSKLYGSQSVREIQLDFKNRLKIAKLVGQKPMLRCQLNEKWVDALWDTGSMITLVDRIWLQENFADEEVIPVEEFFEGENLTIRAANKSLIPFDGVVVLRFSLGEGHE